MSIVLLKDIGNYFKVLFSLAGKLYIYLLSVHFRGYVKQTKRNSSKNYTLSIPKYS